MGIGKIDTIVPPGVVSIEATCDSYESETKTIAVQQHQQESVSFELTSIYGRLRINSDPPGATVTLNKKAAGVTPFENHRLLPAQYGIGISAPGYNPIDTIASISKNQLTEKNFSLAHTKAYNDSIANFKDKRKQKAMLIRKIVFGGLGVGTGCVGFIFNVKTKQSIERQADAHENYMRATSDFDQYKAAQQNAQAEAQQSARARNVLYCLAGAGGLGFIVSFAF